MRQGDDYLADVVPCIACGESWCRIHWKHRADCSCPGPHDGESDIECREDVRVCFECDRRASPDEARCPCGGSIEELGEDE